jgi:micrococcal nuclease
MEEQLKSLKEVDIIKIKSFEIKLKTKALIVSVYDGDTINAIFPFNNVLYRWRCRLIGIDSPELKKVEISEKELALISRNYLRSVILDKIVDLDCNGFDKYGRILVNITIDGINVNEDLIKNGYAKLYS